MTYEINWDPAVDDVRFLQPDVRKRVVKKVGSIADHPFRFVERLQGFVLLERRMQTFTQ